jgi:hypothetical protein
LVAIGGGGEVAQPAMLRRESTATIAKASFFMEWLSFIDALTRINGAVRSASAEKTHLLIRSRRGAIRSRLELSCKSIRPIFRGYLRFRPVGVANMPQSEETLQACKRMARRSEVRCRSANTKRSK